MRGVSDNINSTVIMIWKLNLWEPNNFRCLPDYSRYIYIFLFSGERKLNQETIFNNIKSYNLKYPVQFFERVNYLIFRCRSLFLNNFVILGPSSGPSGWKPFCWIFLLQFQFWPLKHLNGNKHWLIKRCFESQECLLISITWSECKS